MTYKEALNILFEETPIEIIKYYHEARDDYWKYYVEGGEK